MGIMIYEMVYGITPFDKPGLDNMGLMRAIIRDRLEFPDLRYSSRIRRSFGSTETDEVNDLITKMLHKKTFSRLGCWQRGAQDIRDHEWLKNINTEKLLEKSILAPSVPTKSKKRNYPKDSRGSIIEEKQENPICDQKIKNSQQKLFAEF